MKVDFAYVYNWPGFLKTTKDKFLGKDIFPNYFRCEMTSFHANFESTIKFKFFTCTQFS